MKPTMERDRCRSSKNNRHARLSHGDWIVPHVGGPILPPGAPTVLIDFLPAATVTTMATCVGRRT